MFSSGCLPSLSGSRTLPDGLGYKPYVRFCELPKYHQILFTKLLSHPAPTTPNPGPEPEMLTFPFNSLFKTAHFQLRLPPLSLSGSRTLPDGLGYKPYVRFCELPKSHQILFAKLLSHHAPTNP